MRGGRARPGDGKRAWRALAALCPRGARRARSTRSTCPRASRCVPTLVPREHLPSAISLNAIVMQSAAVAGPAMGGIVIASAGLTWVYVVNAVSFGFVIAGLLMMRGVPDRPDAAQAGNDISWRAAREGLRFVFSSPLIRSTMLLDFFATFFSSGMALLPIFAQDILRIGPRGYGWLYAAPATGAVVMSLAMVLLTHHIKRRGPVLLWAVVDLRRRDGGLRPLAIVLDQLCVPRDNRRGRHRQRRHPQHRAPARNARPSPRADAGREHGVLARRAGARRAGSRSGRELDRRAARRSSPAVSAAWPRPAGLQRRLPNCAAIGRNRRPRPAPSRRAAERAPRNHMTLLQPPP